MRSLFVFLFATSCIAQVDFRVTPPQIGVNEQIRFIITISGSDTGRLPSFPKGMNTGDFKLVNNSPSSSREVSYTNGKVTQFTTYTYTLRPTKKGTLNFPAQEILYSGKKWYSPAKRIKVGEETRNLSKRRDRFNRSRRTEEPAEIFAEMEVSKETYYLGEVIPLTVILYKTPGVGLRSQGSSMELPDFKDYWVEEVEEEPRDHIVVKNGKRYEKVVVGQRLLYANKAGKLEIDPTVFSLTVVLGGFFGDVQRVQRQTNKLKINVKSLPTAGRPAGFNGVVGRFRLKGSLDAETVKAGESVSMNLELTGQGNFAGVPEPQPDSLEGDFEIFDGGAPTVNKRRGIIDTKTWRYALVPRREGSFEFAQPTFDYFDPIDEVYRSAGSETFKLEVLPGEQLAEGGPIGNNRRMIVAEQNMSYIKLRELGNTDERMQLFSPSLLTKLAVIFLILDLLVFIGLFLRNRGQSRQANMRPKFALKNYRRATSRLNTQSEDSESFYAGLSGAIFDYFGDKWERPGKGISLELIQDQLERAEIDKSIHMNVAECIEACDLARFTPSSASSRENLLNKANETVMSVEAVL